MKLKDFIGSFIMHFTISNLECLKQDVCLLNNRVWDNKRWEREDAFSGGNTRSFFSND